MRLVHYPVDGDDGDGSDGIDDGDGSDGTGTDSSAAVLATDVDIADSLLTQTRGLMFRRSLPDGSALAFRFDSAAVRDVHMLFVFFQIDAVWIADGVVQRVERLRPWLSFARAECDLLVELPAGAADGVKSGDRIVLES